MSSFSFDELPERGKWSSATWSGRNEAEIAAGVVPMTSADMNFVAPPCIRNAAIEAAEFGVYGYTVEPKGYRETICKWMHDRHDWTIKPEWIVPMSGVVPAMSVAVRCFTQEGDKVLMLKPGYPPFSSCTVNNGREEFVSELVYNDKDGSYSIDFADVEAKLKDSKCHLMFMCSPHNPVGRIWSPEELLKIAKLCKENDVTLCCDEIHHDLIMPGQKFVTIANAAADFMDNIIVFTAATKTFNLAGLQICSIIIANEKMREAFCKRISADGSVGIPFIGVHVAMAAYREGGEWLDALIEYIQGNYDFMKEFLAREIPAVKMTPLGATYLAWANLNPLGVEKEKLFNILREGGFYASRGGDYGRGGEGFLRINLALPRYKLEEALKGATAALKKAGIIA